MGQKVHILMVAGLIVGSATVALAQSNKKSPRQRSVKVAVKTPAAPRWRKPAPADIKQRLTPTQFHVTQDSGTEPPFRNQYWDNHAEGIYVDVVTGEPLFSSKDKFESGTGWPSFVRPLVAAHVIEKRDESHGMVRVEVRSKHGDSHLGHLFDDGPAPTGLRYCINSASLRFIPAAELARAGYPDLARTFTAKK